MKLEWMNGREMNEQKKSGFYAVMFADLFEEDGIRMIARGYITIYI